MNHAYSQTKMFVSHSIVNSLTRDLYLIDAEYKQTNKQANNIYKQEREWNHLDQQNLACNFSLINTAQKTGKSMALDDSDEIRNLIMTNYCWHQVYLK